MPKKRIQILIALIGLVAGAVGNLTGAMVPKVQAASCPDVRLVFARGSGSERWTDQNYLTWKDALESKLKLVDLSYEFIDLDYIAMGVGLDNFWPSVRALTGSGDAYEFGASVDSGVDALKEMINYDTCAHTKYVLGGYSQGAMVVSKAVHNLKAEKIIYAATFGDPKIYLPEGEGAYPDACRGKNLSDYRAYVPDCRTFTGLLGAYIPYEPEGYDGKIGTWCNHNDIFCSPYLDVNSHLAYVSDNLYEDASRLIFDKITQDFGIENTYVAPHDTVILLDSSGSMSRFIERYKAEAIRLAAKLIEVGGRVALYDYRDLDDPYSAVQRCDFETCTLEKVEEELAKIECDNGGDVKESMHAAAKTAMKNLSWQYGAVKSMVVLTDTGALNPDRDGTTAEDVVALSKKIDPVNFYIVTTSEWEWFYEPLAKATGGRTASLEDALALRTLADEILARYDSLNYIETRYADEVRAEEVPAIKVMDYVVEGDTATFYTVVHGGSSMLVLLNDYLVGVSDNTHMIELSGLDMAQENRVTLVPLSDTMRGEGMTVILTEVAGKSTEAPAADDKSLPDIKDADDKSTAAIVPKAPNTGRR